MIKVLILDLDDTLIDTKTLEPLRKQRAWREIPNYYGNCKVYDEVLNILNTARSSNIKIAIFTNSPSNYAKGLLTHFNIHFDILIAYHDVRPRIKPDATGVHKILNHFGVSKDEAVYIGDNDLDCQSAKNADVEFFGVEWGEFNDCDYGHRGLSKISKLL